VKEPLFDAVNTITKISTVEAWHGHVSLPIPGKQACNAHFDFFTPEVSGARISSG
jgi:hypothetical protein